MSTPVEFLFHEFLAEQKRLSAQGISLETIFHRISGVDHRLAGLETAVHRVSADQIEINVRLDRYGRKLYELRKEIREEKVTESKTDRQIAHRLEDDELDNTGVFRALEKQRAKEIEDLKTKIDKHDNRRDSDVRFWQRQRGLWLALVLLGLWSAFLSACGGLSVWYVTSKHSAKGP